MKKGFTIYKDIAKHILDESAIELNKLADINYFTADEVKQMVTMNIDRVISEWNVHSQLTKVVTHPAQIEIDEYHTYPKVKLDILRN